MKTKKLNLGCGKNKMKGYVNVDFNPFFSPEIIHDLNVFPYPFKDNEFEEIYLDHVLEHLNNPFKVLEEIYRIAKNNAKVIVKCPHFSCNWLNPSHRSAISSYLFNYFNPQGSEGYGEANFKVEKIKLYWLRNRKDYLEHRHFLVKIFNVLINFLANLNLSLAERVWCYWVGGFEEIVFEARVLK